MTLDEAIASLRESLDAARVAEEHLKELLSEAGMLEGLEHLLGGDEE